MACDIHAHTEVKINGVWHHYAHPRIGRLYQLFARMGDVRNEEENDPDRIEPVAANRGIPDDATFMTKFDHDRWDTDAHSASWMSGKEVDELEQWADKFYTEEMTKNGGTAGWFSLAHHHIGYIFGNGWHIGKYEDDKDSYPEGVEDARLIFWFDN